jgi:hypothetical protein
MYTHTHRHTNNNNNHSNNIRIIIRLELVLVSSKMLRVYDEGIDFEDLSVEDGEEDHRQRQPHALRDASINTSLTPKPPVYKRKVQQRRRMMRKAVQQEVSPDITSVMIPILSQITSSFAVMNPMNAACIREEERERIKSMSMCIERYTRSGQKHVMDGAVEAWVERLLEFSEGPMMMDLNQYALGKEHMRMGKDSLRAVSTARKLIDSVYRFGDDTSHSSGKTCLYLYHMYVLFLFGTDVLHYNTSISR